MKHFIQRRFFPVFLCMALALSLTACGGRGNQPAGDKTGDTAGTLSGSKGEKDSGAGVASGSGEETAEADLESAEASLDLLYDAMAFDDQYAGAVAYLGYREQGDSTPMADWLVENCAGLTEAMPFLLHVPAEHILGPGYGDLFCIVPRDETTMLTVEHVTWVPSQFEVGEVTDEVLYQARSAQPVLIFKNLDDSHPLPDVHITLEPDNGPMCEWFPDVDEYDALSIPGYPENPILLDFAIWGDVTGLDYPDGGIRPQPGSWPTPTGPVNTGTWKSAGGTVLSRTMKVSSISTTSRRTGRSTHLLTPASGAWRTAAFVWSYLTGWAALSAGVSR